MACIVDMAVIPQRDEWPGSVSCCKTIYDQERPAPEVSGTGLEHENTLNCRDF